MQHSMELLVGGLWSGNPWLGKLIVLAIVCVFGRAALLGNRLLRRYRLEFRDLRTVRRRLHAWREQMRRADEESEVEDEPGAVEAEADPGEEAGATSAQGSEEEQEMPGASGSFRHPDLIDTGELLEGLDPESFIAERIRAIEKMRSFRVKVDIETLQGMAARRHEAWRGRGFPALAARLSLMLGILGTFLGLSLMVQQIHLGLPQGLEGVGIDAWTDSVRNLQQVLGGMRTAFSSSLLGMGCAIFSSLIAYRIDRISSALFEDLERLTGEDLLAATVPTVEDELLLERVTFQLEESFDRIDGIFDKNQEVLEELTAAQQAFATIVDEVRSITKGQSARNLDELITEVARTNQSVVSVAEHLPRLARSMESTQQEISQSFQDLRRSWPAVPEEERIFGLRPASWLVFLGIFLASLLLKSALGGL